MEMENFMKANSSVTYILQTRNSWIFLSNFTDQFFEGLSFLKKSTVLLNYQRISSIFHDLSIQLFWRLLSRYPHSINDKTRLDKLSGIDRKSENGKWYKTQTILSIHMVRLICMLQIWIRWLSITAFQSMKHQLMANNISLHIWSIPVNQWE